MKNIKNIKIAIMELFQKANEGVIKEEVAEYFIDKLDTISYEINQSVKRSGLHTNNLTIYKYFDDILVYLNPKIYFELEKNKKEVNIQLIEDKFGENARKVFFMKQHNGSYVYLGSIIDLDKDIDNEVYLNIKRATISPYTYEQIADDNTLFSRLNKINIEKYKAFIDKNLRCLSAMVDKNNHQKSYDALKDEWIKEIKKEGLDYRIDYFINSEENK